MTPPAEMAALADSSRAVRQPQLQGRPATLWLVSGNNGENVIHASGRSLAEAYWRACVQARELGLLAPARGRHPREG